MVECLSDRVVPQEFQTRAATRLRAQVPALPHVPQAVHELLARRACLSEVQVFGGLADEPLDGSSRALEEARAKGRNELTQTQVAEAD